MKIYSFLYTVLLSLLAIPAIGSDEDTTLTNLFNMPIEDLIEQKVTIATKSSLSMSQTPSVVSVVTSDEIKAMGYRDLEEVLQTIPGITFGQVRNGLKSAQFRGVSDIRQGGRILILQDGSPYNGIMYGSAIFFGNTFDLDAVDRIEVIRGPGSALYGRNAFNAVVNIITKKAKKDKDVLLGASYGSFNTADIFGSYGLKKNKLSAYISAKYFTTDGTSSKFDNGMGGESIYNNKHDNIYINANSQFKNFQFYGSYVRRVDGWSSTVFPYISNGDNVFNIGTYSLKYDKEINSRFGIGAKIYGRNENRIQNVEHATPYTTYPIRPGAEIPINAFYPEGGYAQPVFDAYTYGLEIEGNYKIVKNNSFLLGIQADLHGIRNAEVKSNYDLKTWAPRMYINKEGDTLQYSKDNMPIYEPGWIINGGHDYSNVGIYFQDAHRFFNTLSLTVGGRFDIDSEVGFIFNPRLAMVWEPSSWSAIKLLYGEAYRAPTTNEQYKIVGFDMGNEKLGHEEIKTTELVFSTKFNKIFSQVSLYYNKLDNLIQQLHINKDTTSYFNTGKNTSYGFEIESRFFISKSVYSFVNYSYNHSEDAISIEDIEETVPHPNVADHLVNFGLNTELNKYLRFTLLFRYVSPIRKFKNTNEDIPHEYVSQDHVGDYFMLNSSIRLVNLLKGLELSLYGYNLLNSEYYFQDNQFQNQPAQPEINFLVRATYNFN